MSGMQSGEKFQQLLPWWVSYIYVYIPTYMNEMEDDFFPTFFIYLYKVIKKEILGLSLTSRTKQVDCEDKR